MKTLLDEHARSSWEFAWAYTGRTDTALACLALAATTWEATRLPSREPDRRRAVWRILVDSCRQQVSARPPGDPESGDPRLAAILSLPLELREVLLLLRYHGASGEDLGATLGTSGEVALGRAQRALSRVALAQAMPGS